MSAFATEAVYYQLRWLVKGLGLLLSEFLWNRGRHFNNLPGQSRLGPVSIFP
jgi:hypothetical protein